MENDIRTALNKIKWDDRFDMTKLRIYYVDRGQPNNRSVASGDDIVDIHQHFFATPGGMIPFHRVVSIRYGDEVLFRR